MEPLSTYFTKEVECWLKQHLGRCVTVFRLANLFGNTYLKSATAQTTANGFRKIGSYPISRNIYENYARFSVTDQVQPRADGNALNGDVLRSACDNDN